MAVSNTHRFRPDLINKLYDALGPPCTQCGRRFKTDEEGRKKKTAHMDWHFKVHQRSAEAEKRGMHRSWYVDQQVRIIEVFSSQWLYANYNRTGSNLEKLSTLTTWRRLRIRRTKHLKRPKDLNISLFPNQEVASTLYAQSAKKDSRTSGLIQLKNGFG